MLLLQLFILLLHNEHLLLEAIDKLKLHQRLARYRSFSLSSQLRNLSYKLRISILLKALLEHLAVCMQLGRGLLTLLQ